MKPLTNVEMALIVALADKVFPVENVLPNHRPNNIGDAIADVEYTDAEYDLCESGYKLPHYWNMFHRNDKGMFLLDEAYMKIIYVDYKFSKLKEIALTNLNLIKNIPESLR